MGKIKINIWIEEELKRELKKIADSQNKTLSELTEEGLDFVIKKYKGKMDRRIKEFEKALKDVFGIWKKRKIDIQKYIRNLRKDRVAGY